MATFDDTPFEVFTNWILPCLSVVDVGRLAQVNTTWRDFTGEETVWENMYLRLSSPIISDTSLHIGPKSVRQRDHEKEYDIFRATGKSTIIYCGGYPFVPATTNRCKGSKAFLHHTWCCDCMPKDLKDKLKTWRDIRTDGIDTDNFERNQVYQNTFNTAEYCSYVNSEWMEYNRRRGLSTVNLCQNPEHYSLDTLSAPTPEDYKKKKSFKKETLKILEKAPKTEITKATREKKALLKKLEKARQMIEQLELQYLEAEAKEIKSKKIVENIRAGISRT